MIEVYKVDKGPLGKSLQGFWYLNWMYIECNGFHNDFTTISQEPKPSDLRNHHLQQLPIFKMHQAFQVGFRVSLGCMYVTHSHRYSGRDF